MGMFLTKSASFLSLAKNLSSSLLPLVSLLLASPFWARIALIFAAASPRKMTGYESATANRERKWNLLKASLPVWLLLLEDFGESSFSTLLIFATGLSLPERCFPWSSRSHLRFLFICIRICHGSSKHFVGHTFDLNQTLCGIQRERKNCFVCVIWLSALYRNGNFGALLFLHDICQPYYFLWLYLGRMHPTSLSTVSTCIFWNLGLNYVSVPLIGIYWYLENMPAFNRFVTIFIKNALLCED